jgi:hypothetical protein
VSLDLESDKAEKVTRPAFIAPPLAGPGDALIRNLLRNLRIPLFLFAADVGFQWEPLIIDLLDCSTPSMNFGNSSNCVIDYRQVANGTLTSIDFTMTDMTCCSYLKNKLSLVKFEERLANTRERRLAVGSNKAQGDSARCKALLEDVALGANLVVNDRPTVRQYCGHEKLVEVAANTQLNGWNHWDRKRVSGNDLAHWKYHNEANYAI